MRTLPQINRLIIFATLLSVLAFAQANSRFQTVEASEQPIPRDTLITIEKLEQAIDDAVNSAQWIH